MDTVQIIAQAVGIAAMGFNILSFQRKSRGGVIAFQLLGSLLFSMNFLMLGATMGCILNIISAIRAIIFLNREKLNANHPAWLAGFSPALYHLTFQTRLKACAVLPLVKPPLETLPPRH